LRTQAIGLPDSLVARVAPLNSISLDAPGEAKAVDRLRIGAVVETVVALPEDLRAALDRRASTDAERDELVAEALRVFLALPRRGEDAADLAILNAHAAELNAEAEDALSYQAPW
jgi:hypothetical protein